MMNLTNKEEKNLEQNVQKKPKAYFYTLLCPQNHELNRAYSRKFATGSLQVIPKMFYCIKCEQFFELTEEQRDGLVLTKVKVPTKARIKAI